RRQEPHPRPEARPVPLPQRDRLTDANAAGASHEAPATSTHTSAEHVGDGACDRMLHRRGRVAEFGARLLRGEPNREPRNRDLVTVDKPRGGGGSRDTVRDAQARRPPPRGVRDQREGLTERDVLAAQQVPLPTPTALPREQVTARDVMDV